VSAVAAANPHTIVVAETGGPVTMPWAGQVSGILEAWFPGIGGGPAIANILFGDVNPSAKLPVTFAKSDNDLPHPQVPGLNLVPPPDAGRGAGAGAGRGAGGGGGGGRGAMPPFDVPYTEKLEVGYKWFDAENKEPLFAFGHGLSYTAFAVFRTARYGGGPQRDRIFRCEEYRQARRQGDRGGIRDASGWRRRATQEADRLAEGAVGGRARASRSLSPSTRCTFPSSTRARTALRSPPAITRSGRAVRPGTCRCRRQCRSGTEEPSNNNFTLAAWAAWRRHSCLPRPDSSGRVPGVRQRAFRRVGGAIWARQIMSLRHVGGCEIILAGSLSTPIRNYDDVFRADRSLRSRLGKSLYTEPRLKRSGFRLPWNIGQYGNPEQLAHPGQSAERGDRSGGCPAAIPGAPEAGWYLSADPRLSANAADALDSATAAGERIHVPSICLVELTCLVEKGRLPVAARERLIHALDDPAVPCLLAPLDRTVADAL